MDTAALATGLFVRGRQRAQASGLQQCPATIPGLNVWTPYQHGAVALSQGKIESCAGAAHHAAFNRSFCTGYQDRTKVKGDFPIPISRAIPVPFALHYI
ncbi:MAG: hypothetical protein DMG97_08075 [Acidobacteria bacterium]|nr:MAG: hypothetical protein DMG98_04900 [Acidobacteriota bacterium]PYV74713.1 MAG: hypothetical protein DMG97_08075 [Acidobacteriota bacterium]